MHKEITGWIEDEDCAYRHISGADPKDISMRVAMIEKTPRVRIRSALFRLEQLTYSDGTRCLRERWPEHLDWCEGYKGSGPNDSESRAWCDGMLKALGYYTA